ncbi:MAG: outer membrane protein assembly factor BamB [Gammaproteobacteria bacterium]
MRAWLLLVVALVAGCGMTEKVGGLLRDKDNAEPVTPLTEFEATAQVDRAWSRGMGKGTDKLFVRLAPVADRNVIYVAERKGRVTAVAADTGRELWDTDTDAPLSGGPGYGDGLVLVGSSEGELIALDAKTGEERWRTAVSSEVLSAPTAADGVAVVRTADGKLAGFSVERGRRLWIYDRTVPNLTLRGNSSPIIVDDIVLAGFDNGRMVALELKTGKAQWEQQVAQPRGRSDLERMIDVDADPVVVGDHLYVTAFQGKVAALSLHSGEVDWTREIPSAAGLAADADRVYVTDDNSLVWALDRHSGSSLWKQEGLRARALTAPAAAGDYVVVGDVEGYLHWLAAGDGKFAARERIDSRRILSRPIMAEGLLVGYSSDGELSAYTFK